MTFLRTSSALFRQINAVAQRLGHLSLAIGARQTQARLILRQQNLRRNQCLTVYAVKLVHDFAGLLYHRHLILAGRNRGRTERRDIGRLTDWICKESNRNARFKIAHLNFRLYRWIALQTRYGNQIHIVHGQLGQLRHLRLNKQCRLCRIQTAGQIIQRNLQNILTNLFRIVCVISQCLCICNHNEDFIVFTGILQLYAASQGTNIMSQMQFAGRTVAG